MFVLVENHFHSSLKIENTDQPQDEEYFVNVFHEKKIMRRLSRDLEVLPFDLSSHKSDNRKFKLKTIAHVVSAVMKNRCRKLTWEEIQTIKSHQKFSLGMKNAELASLKFEPKVDGRSIRIINESVIILYKFLSLYINLK